MDYVCYVYILILFSMIILAISIGNNTNDMGKFQCGFENDISSSEMDLFNILLLFIIFEVEMIFILGWIMDVGIIFVLILVVIIWEIVYGEIV